MKTLFTICLLAVSAFTLKAQDLSFEETLAYLNKAIKDETSPIMYGGLSSGSASSKPDINSNTEMMTYLKEGIRLFGAKWHLRSINVSKNGNFSLQIDERQTTDFNLFKLNRGFLLFENNIAYSTEKRVVGYLQFVNNKEASRFYKALQHISSFCKEDKDPFDN